MSALPPPLNEERFQQPPGWQWGEFKNSRNISIRYGYAAPDNPRALICILPGRAEFIEKYFETIHDLVAQSYAVCALDWAGQGGSGRISHHHRGDIVDFSILADDLRHLLTNSIPGHLKELPKIALAQSMGGNILLRFLKTHPDIFQAAALCSPMLGIQGIPLPPKPAVMLVWFLKMITGNGYAFGQKDWDPRERLSSDIFSNDPVRGNIHDTWYTAKPELQIGGVTFGWLYHALKSCAVIQNPDFPRSIDTPCLFALSGREKLVDNEASRKIASRPPHAEVIEFPQAAHEILMEKDEIRSDFLARFYDFVRKYAQT